MMDGNQLDQPPQLNPMDADAYFERGIEYGLADDYENAVIALTEAIRLSPNNGKYYFRRATTHFIASNWNQAIADYTQALRLKPDPNDDDVWNFMIAEIYEHRGIAYRYQGDYKAALADFEELIRLKPDNPHHYRDRSIVYKLNGDFENSLADLYTAQRLNPVDGTYSILIADVLQRQGNKSAAMKIYDEDVERSGSAASYFYRGQLWKEQSNFTKAIGDFEETIKLYPQYHQAYISLGEAYLANGDYTKAIDVLNAVIEREPGYRYIALLLRARTYLASGNLDQATRDFDETIIVNTEEMAKYPAFTQGYVVRGHAHTARGQTEEAIADYNKALEAEPTHREANVMREYILKNS
jgi:tetratricopeptide (TPR) repeat protein